MAVSVITIIPIKAAQIFRAFGSEWYDEWSYETIGIPFTIGIDIYAWVVPTI